MIFTKGQSQNKKLGYGVWSTYRKVGPTCPSSCKALKTKSCYAMYGNVRLHSERAGHEDGERSDGERLIEWVSKLPRVYGGTLVRHHVSGDLYKQLEGGEKVLDMDYLLAIADAHLHNPEIRGWGYTHEAWRELPADILNLGNLTFNASCDSLEEVDEAIALGWPAVTIVAEDAERHETPGGVRVVICPEQTHGTPCSKCRLCFNNQRSCAVGFRVHGFGKNKWDQDEPEDGGVPGPGGDGDSAVDPRQPG